jgi:hypothetical protein
MANYRNSTTQITMDTEQDTNKTDRQTEKQVKEYITNQLGHLIMLK